MNHYLDTSVVVKIYLPEPESGRVHTLLLGDEPVVTSVLTYPETRAVLARAVRTRRLAGASHADALTSLEDDWIDWVTVEVTAAVARRAGWLAEIHALTSLDAVHLASALALHEERAGEVTFWSADHRLATAARREGLRIGNLGRAG